MSDKIFFGILVLAAGLVVGWFVLGNSPGFVKTVFNNKTSNTTVTPSPVLAKNTGGNSNGSETGIPMEKGGVPERTVVTYTDSGFAPVLVSVRKGSIVTFVNESSRGMWVASAVHPTHQVLPGFDQLAAAPKNGTYEYTFEKVGTWKYHNHVNPADSASVMVIE